MEQDKKYKRVGWLTSVLVQIFMLLLFYFLIAWKEPFPPIPTYGIELNFGFEQSGQGEKPVDNTSEELPLEVSETVEEEAVEEPTEETEVEPVEVPQEPIPDPVVTETNVPAVTEQPSPVVEKPKIEKVEVKEKPVEKVIEKKPEPVKEVPKPVEEKMVKEAIMPSTTDKPKAGGSQGNSTPTGDEGKEEGTIDGRAIYGSQGSADGASLQMSGWAWESKPDPKDKSSESGKIVYQITLDDEGYISRIDIITSTVSPEVERVYRQSVERLSFSKTNDYKPAATSKGTVTFIIKTK